MPQMIGRFGIPGVVGVLAGLAVAFLFDPWIDDDAFVVVILITMLVVVVVWEGVQVLVRWRRRAQSPSEKNGPGLSNKNGPGPDDHERENGENRMAWNNSVAHKVTVAYLEMRYSIPTSDLLGDPLIRSLPFYDDDPAFRPLGVRVFAGEFTKFLANMDFKREEGTTFDAAYDGIYSAGMKGDNACSTLGDAVNRHFSFVDEE